MKAVALILGIAVAALSVAVLQLRDKVAGQGATVATLQSEMTAAKAAPPAVPLELQVKCANEAKKAYEATGHRPADLSTYESHYNPKLGRCFIDMKAMTITGNTQWIHRNLFDAIEGKQYGSYSWHSDGVKKYWEVKPVVCEVVDASGSKKTCASEDEFLEMSDAYMGD